MATLREWLLRLWGALRLDPTGDTECPLGESR